jgi:hypothetical protein
VHFHTVPSSLSITEKLIFSFIKIGVLMNQASICIADQFHPATKKPAPPSSLTNIDYNVEREGYVTLKIYDLRGVEIAELVHELKVSGNH